MKIGLVVYPGCVISGLMAFAEILTAANQRSNSDIFDIVWVGIDEFDSRKREAKGQKITVSVPNNAFDLPINVNGSILDSTLDAILLPGFWVTNINKMDEHMQVHQPLITTLRNIHTSTRILSYCTAVAFVAASGLLNAGRATSTWWLSNYIEKKYPQVDWDFSQSILSHHQHITASGLNGYLPIAESLIIKACGNDVLRDIIELMILPRVSNPTLPLQRVKIMQLDNELLQKVYVWVEKTAAQDINIRALASALNTTERTIARRVKKLTGKSCAQFMRLIKINQASDYLIYTQLPINQISHKLGFSDDASFRRLFKALTSHTPGQYRQMHTR